MAVIVTARQKAAAARARLGPLQLMVLVALVSLCGGYFIGTTSRLPWQRTNRRAARPKKAALPQKELIWKGGTAFVADRRICTDSCTGFTRNGICDEGRPSVGPNAKNRNEPQTNSFLVYCDLGTDCYDCGPWVTKNSDVAMKWTPIQDIRSRHKNMSIYLQLTRTPIRFHAAFTDRQQDVDLSAAMHTFGLFEHGFTWVWYKLLEDGCILPDGRRKLVVDVGANFGYYSLLAASMGCRVIAWEPVPHFAAFMKYALLRNDMTRAVTLREGIAGHEAGEQATIMAPNRGIWGTAGIGGLNIDPAVPNDGQYFSITRPVERVDAVVEEDVLILKVDVEGFEPSVLKGCKNLFLKHEVSHIFMEYSPGVAERHQNWQMYEENPVVLMGLVRAGYIVLHMDYGFREKYPDWESTQQFEPFEEVTEAVLVHDIADAYRLQDGTLGCPVPQELQFLSPPFWHCGALPEALDPHSFRATFGHNTNLWAFKKLPFFANIGSPAQLVPESYNIKRKFFVPNGELGAGRRPCTKLAPASQVMHRCPCTDKEECGELEDLVTELARADSLPPFKLIGRTVQPEAMGIETWPG